MKQNLNQSSNQRIGWLVSYFKTYSSYLIREEKTIQTRRQLNSRNKVSNIVTSRTTDSFRFFNRLDRGKVF